MFRFVYKPRVDRYRRRRRRRRTYPIIRRSGIRWKVIVFAIGFTTVA